MRADVSILEAQINTLQKLNNGASEEVRSSRGRISELEAENGRLRETLKELLHLLQRVDYGAAIAHAIDRADAALAQQPDPVQDKDQP